MEIEKFVEAKLQKMPKEEEVKEEPVKVEEIEMIDTSSTPAEKKEAPSKEEKADSQGLTEDDKVAIEKIMDERLVADLQTIYSKIIEKAEFLIKLQVPMAYLVKDPSIKK